ncbi:MAG: site-specific DNA-methyltransferase, partial [Planctomycetota bacterium]
GPEEPPEDPTTQVGDVWLLGEHHRLICGDSTDPAVLAELMQGERASLVWTDPPYGVSYIGGTKDEMTIENDDLDLADLESLLEGAFGSAADACEPGAVWYVAAPAGPNFLPFAKRLSELGIWRQTLVWEKDSLVLGRSDYHYRHEAILYGWVPGAAHHAPKTRALDTILKFARPKSSPDHPTMKPVPLVQHCIETSSKPGGIILDPFSGSGTTLLAAESCARKARCIELDPRYCDVIVRRFEEATGKGTTLEGSDLSFADVATQRGAS